MTDTPKTDRLALELEMILDDVFEPIRAKRTRSVNAAGTPTAREGNAR